MSQPVLKGFKVTNSKHSRSCGIAANSLDELISKSCKKFKLTKEENPVLYLQDGTIIDTEDYFSTLQPQTTLILARDDETILTGADIIYNTLAAINVDVLRAGSLAGQFMSDNLKEKVRKLAKLVADQDREGDGLEESQLTEELVGDGPAFGSTRSEDPEWFEGLDSRSLTKEAYMCRRCADRMRSYMYKTSNDIRGCEEYRQGGVGVRTVLDGVLEDLKNSLSAHHYMGHYFDRSQSSGEAFCDHTGWFTCAGAWNTSGCKHRKGRGHIINPYKSRESRIVFSTWNLDHRIERARSVIPAMISAAVASTLGADLVATKLHPTFTCKLNVEYFFRLLFTHYNLGLVHIVCHDKSAHITAVCDLNQSLIWPGAGLLDSRVYEHKLKKVKGKESRSVRVKPAISA